MKNKPFSALVIFLLIMFAGVSCNKQESVRPAIFQNDSRSDLIAGKFPRPDHIVLVVEENHSFSQIIGSDSAPFINSLAKDSNAVLFTKSYAITHPSQPNYLHLYSGSDQGVTDDNHPANEPFTTPNLGGQLIAAGYSFATYSQGLPYAGFNGDTWGAYVRRHNPAANWMGSGTNQIPSTTNQPFTAFPSDYSQLPTVSLVVPNLNCGMHDGSISKADTWLKYRFSNYLQWAKTNNSLFILTFDEDNKKDSNHIVTIFYGPMVRSGKDSITINHYRVLRTIEDMYGLPYAGNAANVKTIANCWR